MGNTYGACLIRKMVLKSLIGKIAFKATCLFIPETAEYKEATLPAKHLRFCGPAFLDDKYFFESALAEADRLVEHSGLSTTSRILDVGCGVGRLPIGILSRIGEIRHYRGIDVSKKSIRWCQHFITQPHPNFKFIHIDVKNPRYNPYGKAIDSDFRLPFDDHEFDIIYLYSVFSHMVIEDVRAYLDEFRRLLTPLGKIFMTAFIEEGVPDVTINPRDYVRSWIGALHCVRYGKDFFVSLLEENDFAVDHFDHGKEVDRQSALYVSRRR